MTMTKNTARQYQGLVNRAQGLAFENLIERGLDYYRRQGLAVVEKTPEPMRVIKSLSGGRFQAVFTKKAQPDYKGTLNGGRAVVFEAKYTGSDSIEQSRVTPEQVAALEAHCQAGALCFVLVGFESGTEMWCIPWPVWRNMQNYFGHKHIKHIELSRETRVRTIIVPGIGYVPLIFEGLI